MESETSYFVYAIKCVRSDKFYIGVSNSTSEFYNPLKWMLRQNKYAKGEFPKYAKLCEEYKEQGAASFKYFKTKITGTREKCELKAYKMLENMTESKYLNDRNVNPERFECEKCGKELKLVYKDVHEEKYCVDTLEKEIEMFE